MLLGISMLLLIAGLFALCAALLVFAESIVAPNSDSADAAQRDGSGNTAA